MHSITFISGNQKKADQVQKYVQFPLTHHKLDLDEIQSLDIEEIVRHKVMQAYQAIKQPVLVDDTSLSFNYLGNLPGPFIKFFLKEVGNERLCEIAKSFPDKTGVATVCMGFYDGKTLRIFKESITGSITEEPLGDKGYGWDSIFLIDGIGKTWAQMDEDEVKKTSIRQKVLLRLHTFLEDYYKNEQ